MKKHILKTKQKILTSCNVDIYIKKQLVRICSLLFKNLVRQKHQLSALTQKVKAEDFHLSGFPRLVGIEALKDTHHCHQTRTTCDVKGVFKNNRQNCFCVM